MLLTKGKTISGKRLSSLLGGIEGACGFPIRGKSHSNAYGKEIRRKTGHGSCIAVSTKPFCM